MFFIDGFKVHLSTAGRWHRDHAQSHSVQRASWNRARRPTRRFNQI